MKRSSYFDDCCGITSLQEVGESILLSRQDKSDAVTTVGRMY